MARLRIRRIASARTGRFGIFGRFRNTRQIRRYHWPGANHSQPLATICSRENQARTKNSPVPGENPSETHQHLPDWSSICPPLTGTWTPRDAHTTLPACLPHTQWVPGSTPSLWRQRQRIAHEPTTPTTTLPAQPMHKCIFNLMTGEQPARRPNRHACACATLALKGQHKLECAI